MAKFNPEVLKAIAVTAELTGRTFSEVAARQLAEDLTAYPDDKVLDALRRCRSEVSSPLTLAHITSRIRDGRPGADEAWAIALRGVDESETVVTTPEITEAFAIAREVLDGGDEVGARMAFKDAYGRIVLEARSAKKEARWYVSLGWNVEKRHEPVRKAVEAGLLPAPTAAALLPAPMGSEGVNCSPEGLARLKDEMAKLNLKNAQEDEAREVAREEARQAEIARKRAISDAVALYQAKPIAA